VYPVTASRCQGRQLQLLLMLLLLPLPATIRFPGMSGVLLPNGSESESGSARRTWVRILSIGDRTGPSRSTMLAKKCREGGSKYADHQPGRQPSKEHNGVEVDPIRSDPNHTKPNQTEIETEIETETEIESKSNSRWRSVVLLTTTRSPRLCSIDRTGRVSPRLRNSPATFSVSKSLRGSTFGKTRDRRTSGS